MRPKYKALILLLAAFSALVYFTGCASTVVKNNAGKSLFSTQADIAHLDLHTANGDSLVMDAVNHSEPTRAGGNAFATGNDSVARGVIGGVAAANSAGLLQKIITVGVPAIPTRSASPLPR